MTNSSLLLRVIVVTLAIAFSSSQSSQGAVVLFIDDFEDEIGVSEEADTEAGVQSFKVGVVGDLSDTATVTLTLPGTAAADRTSTLVSTGDAVQSTALVIGGANRFSYNNGSLASSTMTVTYDYTPTFDLTDTGTIDSVELTIVTSDIGMGNSGSFDITFFDGTNTATWDLPETAGTHTTTFAAMTNGGAVNFSALTQIQMNLTGDKWDMSVTAFGGSTPLIPEPSASLLLLLGLTSLSARRRR